MSPVLAAGASGGPRWFRRGGGVTMCVCVCDRERIGGKGQPCSEIGPRVWRSESSHGFRAPRSVTRTRCRVLCNEQTEQQRHGQRSRSSAGAMNPDGGYAACCHRGENTGWIAVPLLYFIIIYQYV